MNSTIILIGPINAGKSTIGKLLSEKLGLPQCSMDSVRFEYYKEIGYDEGLAHRIFEAEGFWGVYKYWKPFEAYAVERILSERTNCVIDFGAGHSVYEDDVLFKQVQQVLAPYPNIILLLPTTDPDESLDILNERDESFREMKPNINDHFIKHHSNYDLAKVITYTNGKTPEETCEEILHKILLFSWSDAWLILSIALADNGDGASLEAILAVGDWINHAIFTGPELRRGIAKLMHIGFVTESDGRFSLSGEAKAWWTAGKETYKSTRERMKAWEDFLCVTPLARQNPATEDPEWHFDKITDEMVARAYQKYTKKTISR